MASVNAHSIQSGGIIAAGQGTRLRRDGWLLPKPLVPVGGKPLIEHVIRNYLAAGIQSLTIIFNEEDSSCESWIRSQFPQLDLQILVKTTASSLESFQEVSSRLGTGRAIISTVDAFCLQPDFLIFVQAIESFPPDALLLAVTPFVADERPLWVTMDENGKVTELGGDSGNVVTAGLYVVPESFRQGSMPKELNRLREFLAWLVNKGVPTYGIQIETVIDVDRDEDVKLAEALGTHQTFT
jgi:NDP-sugar pyrophosphorylase family protein